MDCKPSTLGVSLQLHFTRSHNKDYLQFKVFDTALRETWIYHSSIGLSHTELSSCKSQVQCFLIGGKVNAVSGQAFILSC